MITRLRQRKDRRERTGSERTASTILEAAVLVSLVALALVPAVAEAKPYDLDVTLSSGAHIHVNYESGWSLDDQRLTSGNLTMYLPTIADEFWMIRHDGFVTMILEDGTFRGYATGWINRDTHGEIVSYGGAIRISTAALLTQSYVSSVLLHEWVHVFQFWIPNYSDVVGTHFEAAAVAYVNTLFLEHHGWDTADYLPSTASCYVESCPRELAGGQLIWPSSIGLADYLSSFSPPTHSGYYLYKGWEELWYHDRLAFKKFNAWVAALPSGSSVGLRDAVRASLFEGYSDFAYDGLPIDDWLSAFSFYNSLSDVPVGQKMMVWEGSNDWTRAHIIFAGRVFVSNGTHREEVTVSSYDIDIYDAQTRELLFSRTNHPPTLHGALYFSSPFPSSMRPRDILRIDAVAQLPSGEALPVTAYLAARYSERGDRRVLFLNRQGYAEGLVSSNVHGGGNGLVEWTIGDTVVATVTWSAGTYTYVIDNVMAHPAIQLYQIGVPLYQSRTFLSPLAQTVRPGSPAQLTVFASPNLRWKLSDGTWQAESFGTITLYSSRNEVDWVPMMSAKPTDGYASLSPTFSEEGVHYLKATWTGDTQVEPSVSSIVKVEVTTTATEATTTTQTRPEITSRVTPVGEPTTLTISFSPQTVDIGASPPGRATITVTLAPAVSGKRILLYLGSESVSGPWRLISSGETDSSGLYEFSWQPSETGIHFLRAEFAGDALHLPSAATSEPYSLTVVPEFSHITTHLVIVVILVLVILVRCSRREPGVRG